MSKTIQAAYGGPAWSPRSTHLRQEIGTIWANCGLDNEWAALRTVLLHRPGSELDAVSDPNAVQMLATINASQARAQHEALAQAYRQAGVTVHYVEPAKTPPPNQMFVADLLLMTPEGAILGRPASTVRAGEERWIARRLADLGVPILRSVRGSGVFEGADALWLNAQTVLIGIGIRSNAEGATQVADLLQTMDVEVLRVDLPCSVMHLMGTLRFLDQDLAVAWRSRVPYPAVKALQKHGYSVLFIPDEDKAVRGMALNFVTLGPRRILMAADNPNAQAFYEEAGVTCLTVQIDELLKAAGGIGCLTGILERESET